MTDSAKKAVVLLSGGLDSATVLAIARSEDFACHALSFRYGQRHTVELERAQKLARALGAVEHKIADIDLRSFGGSARWTGAVLSRAARARLMPCTGLASSRRAATRPRFCRQLSTLERPTAQPRYCCPCVMRAAPALARLR